MGNYIQITIPLEDISLSEILIAQLSELHYDGFEEGENFLSAFIHEENFSIADLDNIVYGNGLAYTKSVIPSKNWNEEWEKNFEPITVDDFCGIRASFHPPFIRLQHEIIITPKMSFGTGHHATTFLMIKAMSEIEFRNKTVLDFGTGTGILAILSEKIGATKVVAIDNDEWSIRNADENIKENHCKKIILEEGASPEGTGIFDIILANINKNIILQHLASFKQHLAKDGVLLLSGLLDTDYNEIVEEARNHNFRIFLKKERDNWICIMISQS
jgi:ribosomal protein L11 methyltransferase